MRISSGCMLVFSAVLATGLGQAQTAGGAGGGTSGATGANSSTAAATSSVAGDTGVGAPVMGDKMFVKKAIMGNFNEIDSAKMALQKSNNQQVKDYAQKMIDDHQKMLDDLHTLAGQKNIKYKDEPNPEGKKLAAKLSGLSGPEFDKAYINGMVKDHKQDVREFQTEINSGKDQPTKDAAQKSLPIIQDHLQMVQGLQKSMAS
jgi:putative membrane protein